MSNHSFIRSEKMLEHMFAEIERDLNSFWILKVNYQVAQVRVGAVGVALGGDVRLDAQARHLLLRVPKHPSGMLPSSDYTSLAAVTVAIQEASVSDSVV
jgi:hypothetical protein